jgi:hypothetical protein
VSLLFSLLLLVLQAPSTSGTIDGLVLRAGSDEPIAGAQIMITRAGAGTVTIAPVRTDARGRFHFGDLEPGNYRIVAAQNGFVRQEYGQRAVGLQGTPVDVAAGQAAKDIVFRLAATGTITGRVTDDTGLPLTGASVVLLRGLYDAEGRRSLQPVNSVRTDDRGEYRLFWITPGRYFLRASTSRPLDELALNNPASGNVYNGPPRSDGVTQVGNGALYNPNGVIDMAYASTFYTQTTEAARAVPLSVITGNELGGINFVLARQKLARIRGRLVDASGQSPRSGSVNLRSATDSLPPSSYNPATGQFEIRDVPPGTYEVVASMLAPNPATTGNSTLFTRLEVSGADVDNLIFTLRTRSIVSGKFRVEGLSNPAELTGFSRITLRMNLVNGVALGPYVNISATGSFATGETSEGEYRLSLGNLPGDTYLQSIGTTSPNVQVALVPSQRERHELYRDAISDRDGRFSLSGIAPGEYKLFAWEALDRYAFHDLEILRTYESNGKLVQVAPSANLTVDVAAIP